MTFEQAITQFGYPALFLGAFFEGEAFILTAGFLAHRGYLHLPFVMATAFCAAFLSDELFFFLGRSKGMQFLAGKPHWQPHVERIRRILNRHSTAMIFGFRFLYGLRTVSPIVIGMSGFKASRFVALNAVGAVLWSIIMALAGYFFGQLLEIAVEEVKQYEFPVVITLVTLGTLFWISRGYLLLHRKRNNLTQ